MKRRLYAKWRGGHGILAVTGRSSRLEILKDVGSPKGLRSGGNFVRVFLPIALLSSMALSPPAIYAHGGGLDANGCHHDRKHGGYHCHRGSAPAPRSTYTAPAAPATPALLERRVGVVYSYLGEDGARHYSSKPPPPSATDARSINYSFRQAPDLRGKVILYQCDGSYTTTPAVGCVVAGALQP